MAGIMLCDGYDQSQVRFLQLMPGRFITVLHTSGKLNLLFAGKQGNTPDVLQVHVNRIRYHPAFRIQFRETLRILFRRLCLKVRFPLSQLLLDKIRKKNVDAFRLQLFQDLVHLLLCQMKRSQKIGYLAVFQNILL